MYLISKALLHSFLLDLIVYTELISNLKFIGEN